ncbi:Protein kinase, catalytic domain-containing protein [Artemisia annua]|uniref:Protein kinase, catalytic domain-containing protein n=1 Tax=Artemisia annua TaxID=35608 RepID=A0A2U1LPU6_ARTAN|nr:Protein kinase, catalytic domain-containing protein [Artemisia annua]
MSGDGMDHLRIPFEKLKFGPKLEVQGYGTIYEGEFDGRKVALKQLNITNLVNIKPKLLAEILAISRFRQHPNLVALLGFCDEKSNEIILVYEYVASGNLADKMRKRLNTIQRFEICLGAARGLDYLHTGVDESTPGIIHGNIKPSKILLNSNSTGFDAKVSSFGLSKVVPGQSRKNLEPVEPATKESDVYSFGVLLLEVLCGVSEIVDTDDYQERHVSELVPKRMEQKKLDKVVHRDIRKEIKEPALETYAKIACECVIENPEARPTMARVVEELEKALILQGGVVSPVHIPSSINVASAPNETIVEDGNGVTVGSNVPVNEPEDSKDETIDKGATDLLSEDKLDVAGEYNGDEVNIVSTTSETTTEEQGSLIPVSDSVEGESAHDTNDVQKESSNNEPTTTDDINSIKESAISVENKDDNQTKTDVEYSEKEISNDDQKTTEELLDNEVHSSVIVESGSRDFETLPNEDHADEAMGDELQHLRIPFDKIKFGNKIDVRGYGSLFEGEYDNQKVALKRLNITNLANIKPKLLAEILNVARFRKHPNVVALIGFCDEKSNEIILVYEYVSSGNLADKMNKHLTTIQRLEICLDAARGLDYLHTSVDDSTPGIVHGHIKLSKILLNSDSNSSRFKAKVSGFGLSKLLPGDVQIAPRSMDPAYEATGTLTKESDVYTFGVLLLEVLCGVTELVDTDDYQERHVTEVVPKRVEQNNLRKIVHFDIRDEIKTEALETYGKIACRCVMKTPEERPTMAEVIIELEKALRLQGGEVSDLYILGSSNGNGLTEGTINDHDQEGDDTGETMTSYIAEDDSKVTEETVDITAPEDQSSSVPNSDVIDAESIPETTHIKDPQEESSNDVLMSTNDRETTREVVDELVCSDKPIINGENKDVNQSMELATSSEASNVDNTTSIADHTTDQEAQNSGFLKSGNRNFDYLHHEIYAEVIELEDLRISFDEIKFGKKIDTRGYGTLFEGEYNNQQVALKRLNITNLNNIKPKLLDEILTVARFRKHPNVVALIGFCDEKSNEIILVYEYARSGNLADKMSKHLNTIQRLEICLDAARGLEYLHAGVDGIVHGHIKLSKILLNSESNSSRFKAKVSGFGFSRLLPGDVQIAPRSMDPAYEVTGELMKESDVYTFGVLLLEVLCGVPELVDTDDYQERHVTELVPKRLEQDMLRKIVHFDIRNEIKIEALETYAKIACRSVIKNPEERPTMAEVVIELEKALRLQGGEVSSIHILGSRIGNGLTKETVDEVDQQGDVKTEGESNVVEETTANDETEEESKVIEETTAIDEAEEESKVIEETQEDIEDAKKENDENTEEHTVDTKPNEEPVNIVENEIDNNSIEIPKPEESNNGDISNSATLLHSFHRPVLGSEDGHEATERTDTDDAKQEKDNKDDTESKEETMENKITPTEITTHALPGLEDDALAKKIKGGHELLDTLHTRLVAIVHFTIL